MRLMLSRFVFLIVAALICPPVLAAEAGAKPEVTVVYWSSGDCPWCTYWESSMSGMEKKFRASPEFAKIKFYRVKNSHLKDPYIAEQFSPEIDYVWQRYQQTQKNPGRPGWQVWVDRKLVATFQGTKNWDETYFPRIKQIVAENSAQ